MTHFSKSVREVGAMSFDIIERYWNDQAFRAKVEQEQKRRRDEVNSHIDAGMAAINEKQRRRWEAEEQSYVAAGIYASGMPWAKPSTTGKCYDCNGTGTATITHWGQRGADRYEQSDAPCHCPIGKALEEAQ